MISTKETSGNYTPKQLEPSNQKIQIKNISLKEGFFSEGPVKSYDLVLDAVGVDLGDDFDGFYIDNDNHSKGKHKGQSARIKASRFSYENKTIKGKDGKDFEIDRDQSIATFVIKIAKATGCDKWLADNDGKHDTIELFVKAFNETAKFKDQFLDSCISGREYYNKGGYPAYELYFDKFSKDGIPFANPESKDAAKVTMFDHSKNIIAAKNKPVDSFDNKSKSAEPTGFSTSGSEALSADDDDLPF